MTGQLFEYIEPNCKGISEHDAKSIFKKKMILERECLGWHDFLIWWFVFPFFENTRTLSKNNLLPINRQTMKIQVSFTCNTAQFWPCKPLTLLFSCTMVFYIGTRNVSIIMINSYSLCCMYRKYNIYKQKF